MDIINLLNVTTREQLYQWFALNHDKERVCWVRTNRSQKPVPGVVNYVDAVEVALCFGWIDSTQKRGADGRPLQRFSPRRKSGTWCEQNVERCRRLIKRGEMTPAGTAVLPDMNADHFIFYNWVINALKADEMVWKNFQAFPDAYKRIKIWRIQHYADTKRMDEAQRSLQKFIGDTRMGKMQRGWSDGGKLINY